MSTVSDIHSVVILLLLLLSKLMLVLAVQSVSSVLLPAQFKFFFILLKAQQIVSEFINTVNLLMLQILKCASS